MYPSARGRAIPRHPVTAVFFGAALSGIFAVSVASGSTGKIDGAAHSSGHKPFAGADHPAANSAVAIPAASSHGDEATVELILRPGETLLELLQREGIAGDSAYTAAHAVGSLFDTHGLRPGDRITLKLGAGQPRQLLSIHLGTQRHQDLTVVADGDGGFRAASADAPPARAIALRRSGLIGASVSASLRHAGVPSAIEREFLTALADDPDMPHSLPAGTKFSVVYEALEISVDATTKSEAVAPRLRFASVVVGGKEHCVYRYATDQGSVAYVDNDGRGAMPVHLAMPLPGAPVTSPWGWRIHPVLNVRRFHKGVDFGAPEGTPVHAAADGVVEDIGWRNNYGRYIRIRHSFHLETAYAHLSAFANGLRPGSRVHEGQAIAAVGETGLATGPHLYYELLVDGQRINPERQSVNIPVRLGARELRRLRQEVSELNAEINPKPHCSNYLQPDCITANRQDSLFIGDFPWSGAAAGSTTPGKL